MAELLSKRTPRPKSGAPTHHARSQSTPYFQHTRNFFSTDFQSQNDSILIQKPANIPITSSHICATPVNSSRGRLQRHTRSLTASTIPQPPLITTNIKIESIPAVIPSSVFSQSSPIKFDLSPPQSPILPPEKDLWNFIPTFTPERKKPSRSPSPLRISTWFQGESAPINMGVTPSPTKAMSVSSQSDSILEDTRSIAEPPIASKANSVFSSLFSNKAVTTSPIPQVALNDEFFNLDIKEALEPHGQANPFSPSSFKNLQQDAERLLNRMQLAYRQRVLAVISLKSGRDRAEEELDVEKTKSEHLKIQLNSVTLCLDEQNQEIQRLMQQLREERKLRKEEGERHRTVRLVDKDGPFERCTQSRASLNSMVSTPSVLSDAASVTSEPSDVTKSEASSVFSSPETPKSGEWQQQYQQQVPGSHKELRQEMDSSMLDDSAILSQENFELRSRVGHLEKELDSCLELLHGFGL